MFTARHNPLAFLGQRHAMMNGTAFGCLLLRRGRRRRPLRGRFKAVQDKR